MTLQEKLKEEMVSAMRASDAVRLQTLRSVISAFTNELLNLKRTPQDSLSDDEVLSVIKKQAKQRKDSIEQFEKGGRKDLAEAEKLELSVLESYLPEMMSEEEIEIEVKKKREEIGADDVSKKGVLMGEMMKELKGRADGGVVKKIVDKLFL